MLAVSTLISFLSFFLFSDNVRDPLNSTGTVPNDAVTNLRGELRRLYEIVPANAAPEGDGMGQAGEPAGEAQTVI